MEHNCGDKQLNEQCSNVKNALQVIVRTVNDSITNTDNHCKDLCAHMHYAFPTFTEIVANIVNEYGFSKNGDGVIQFTVTAKKLEKYDTEIETLNGRLRKLLLPQIQQ